MKRSLLNDLLLNERLPKVASQVFHYVNETGIILSNLNLPSRLRTSLLLILIKLQKMTKKNKAFKSAFFIRLLNNEFTREFIEELLKFNTNNLHIRSHVH